MNKKSQIAILFFLGISTILFSQDSNKVKSLRFILEVSTSDVDSGKNIENATVKVIGTDSSSLTMKTDSNGVIETNLKPNTSYTIVVSAEGYLNGTGQETTIGFENSTKIFHGFKMQTIHKCKLYGPSINFDLNDYDNPKDSLFPELDILKNYYNLI